MRPVIVRGSRGNAESLGRLLEGQADEIAELDEVGLELAPCSELVEGIIDGEQLIVLNRASKFCLLKLNALLPAAVPQSALGSGAVHENAAHRFGGGGEEMSAVCEFLIFLAHQTQPGLVNQRGGLECLTGLFVGHLVRGKFAQLLIDQRQQFVGGSAIALLDGCQDVSDIAHA